MNGAGNRAQPIELPVLDAQQAAIWDQRAQRAGIASRVLMESAGNGIAMMAAQVMGGVLPRGVLVVAGHGNNGGDGWVAARGLRRAGAPVLVVEESRERSVDCAANRALALEDGVQLVTDDSWPQVDLVIDALLGTGASGVPRGEVGRLAAQIASHGAPVLAVDGPTGLDLSTGEAHGPVVADWTVTFGGFRRGHLRARDACGCVIVLDIGFNPIPEPSWPRFRNDRWLRSVLPPFTASTHKGNRGRVLVVGGQDGMAGAVHFAARAALAVGAGLVRVAAQEKSTAALQKNLPDVTVVESALEGPLDPSVIEAMDWADAYVLGPGLGRGPDRARFVHAFLAAASGPVIIDADAMYAGADALAAGSVARVFTPHLGEFRAAFPEIPSPELYPYAAAHAAIAVLSHPGPTAMLLKGVPTVIASGVQTNVVARGNPALATGGSGDLLAGMIGTFLAQKLSPLDAATAGAQVLGGAADRAALNLAVPATRPADVLNEVSDYLLAADAPPPIEPPILFQLEPPELA